MLQKIFLFLEKYFTIYFKIIVKETYKSFIQFYLSSHNLVHIKIKRINFKKIGEIYIHVD